VLIPAHDTSTIAEHRENEFRLVAQWSHDGLQVVVARCLLDQDMKPAVAFGCGDEVLPRGCFATLFDARPHFPELFGGAIVCGPLGGEGLDDAAQFEQLMRFARLQARNIGATARLDLDQPRGLEGTNRLANGVP